MDIDVPIAAETDHAPQEDWGYAGEEGGYDEDQVRLQVFLPVIF